MTGAQLQIPLFANCGSSSSSDAPSLPASSVRTTSSSELETNTPTAATNGAPSRPAKVPSTRAGALAAVSCSGGATTTAASEGQPMSTAFTSPSTADPMFAIPRPRTRADCRAEARPCPWVGCKHHLLLEVATTRLHAKVQRATSLRLNRASSGKTGNGRRPGLRSSAAADIVRAWIDEAVEMLSWMPETCALDVTEKYPDGLSPRMVGWLLAVNKQAVDAECRKPHVVEAMSELKEFMER